MENVFIDLLPPWIETGLQPAFYDKESGTVLQQTARMYAKVNEVVKNENDLTEKVKYLLEWFDNLDVHEEIDNILHEYIEDGTFYQLLKYNAGDESLTLTFDIRS